MKLMGDETDGGKSSRVAALTDARWASRFSVVAPIFLPPAGLASTVLLGIFI